MSIEIKTTSLKPVRNTFAHIERRFGDKPASRYQEATYDVQSESYFHYRPLWQPEKELNDASRTKIVMEDWYAFKDPRQFYYGTYVQQRARMQESAEGNFAYFEKRQLASRLSEEAKEFIIRCVVPLRHVEHTANLNNMLACADGYGTAITQACIYNGMDRLGIAQYLSRIGLILDGNSGESLEKAKSLWMEDSAWQGVRKLMEETTTVKDWFEVLLVQDVIVDALVYHIFYQQFDEKLLQYNNADIGMLTEFMQVWSKDSFRWIDSVLKVAVAESENNKAIIEGWISAWGPKVQAALAPIAKIAGGDDAIDLAVVALDKRLTKTGLFK